MNININTDVTTTNGLKGTVIDIIDDTYIIEDNDGDLTEVKRDEIYSIHTFDEEGEKIVYL